MMMTTRVFFAVCDEMIMPVFRVSSAKIDIKPIIHLIIVVSLYSQTGPESCILAKQRAREGITTLQPKRIIVISSWLQREVWCVSPPRRHVLLWSGGVDNITITFNHHQRSNRTEPIIVVVETTIVCGRVTLPL
jgi:hypothetical protein